MLTRNRETAPDAAGSIAMARAQAALVILDDIPGGDVEVDPADWPAECDAYVWEPTDPSYEPPADAEADATRGQSLDALAAGQIVDPEPDPDITPEMERRVAFRQAFDFLFGERTPQEKAAMRAALDDLFPPECERRGAWGGHPASEF